MQFPYPSHTAIALYIRSNSIPEGNTLPSRTLRNGYIAKRQLTTPGTQNHPLTEKRINREKHPLSLLISKKLPDPMAEADRYYGTNNILREYRTTKKEI